MIGSHQSRRPAKSSAKAPPETVRAVDPDHRRVPYDKQWGRPLVKAVPGPKLRVPRRRIAVHEAGHAVLACLLKEPFEYVTIRARGAFAGLVKQPPFVPSEKHTLTKKNGKIIVRRVGDSMARMVEKRLLVAHAGFEAERVLLGKGRYWQYTTAFDDDTAFRILMEFYRDEKLANAHYVAALYQTRRIMRQLTVQAAVYVVAMALLDVGRLSQSDVNWVVAGFKREFGSCRKVLRHQPFKPRARYLRFVKPGQEELQRLWASQVGAGPSSQRRRKSSRRQAAK